MPQSSFNPRVLAGGRDLLEDRANAHQAVSIHASSREDATFNRPRQPVSKSFNPRVLAGGRDVEVVEFIAVALVSIHASSREDATFLP